MTGAQRKNRFYLIVFLAWAGYWAWALRGTDHEIKALDVLIGGPDMRRSVLAVNRKVELQAQYDRETNLALGMPIGVFFLIAIGDFLERNKV